MEILIIEIIQPLPNPPSTKQNLKTSLEQKFSYGDIRKYTDICFQRASRMQFLAFDKWGSANAYFETKQNHVCWKICKVRKVFGCVAGTYF